MKKIREYPTQAKLKELFRYDGGHLYWKAQPRYRAFDLSQRCKALSDSDSTLTNVPVAFYSANQKG